MAELLNVNRMKKHPSHQYDHANSEWQMPNMSYTPDWDPSGYKTTTARPIATTTFSSQKRYTQRPSVTPVPIAMSVTPTHQGGTGRGVRSEYSQVKTPSNSRSQSQGRYLAFPPQSQPTYSSEMSSLRYSGRQWVPPTSGANRFNASGERMPSQPPMEVANAPTGLVGGQYALPFVAIPGAPFSGPSAIPPQPLSSTPFVLPPSNNSEPATPTPIPIAFASFAMEPGPLPPPRTTREVSKRRFPFVYGSLGGCSLSKNIWGRRATKALKSLHQHFIGANVLTQTAVAHRIALLTPPPLVDDIQPFDISRILDDQARESWLKEVQRKRNRWKKIIRREKEKIVSLYRTISPEEGVRNSGEYEGGFEMDLLEIAKEQPRCPVNISFEHSSSLSPNAYADPTVTAVATSKVIDDVDKDAEFSYFQFPLFSLPSDRSSSPVPISMQPECV